LGFSKPITYNCYYNRPTPQCRLVNNRTGFISKPVAKALDTKQRQKKRGRKKIFKTAAFLEKPK